MGHRPPQPGLPEERAQGRAGAKPLKEGEVRLSQKAKLERTRGANRSDPQPLRKTKPDQPEVRKQRRTRKQCYTAGSRQNFE